MSVLSTYKPTEGQAELHVVVLETDAFIVGAANGGTGVRRLASGGEWEAIGWRNARAYRFGWDKSRPHMLYLAAGNGLHRSVDAGRSWRTLTGWDITEVLDVAVDPFQPDRLYIATAYGVFVSSDLGETWSASSHGIPAPTSTCAFVIETDRAHDGCLIVGTDGGLFRSEDGAQSWQPVGPGEAAIRDLHQSAADPGLWLAGTEDRGALISRNGGMSWASVDGPFRTSTIYATAFDPLNARRMAVAGYGTGVYVSDDGGESWKICGSGFPDRHVHALAFDPEQSGRLWAGTVGGGVFFLNEQGEWVHAGLDGTTIWDMEFVSPAGQIPPVRKGGSRPEAAPRFLPSAPGPGPTRAPQHPIAGYEARRNDLIDFFADRGPDGYIEYREFIEVAAKLYRNRPMEEVLPLLDPLLANPHGDMFWMYPMVLVQYLGLGRLPDEYHRRMRSWRTYTPYRGDTENHWAMYYASLYLTAQLYPDEPGECWYNGRSSSESFEEAREYLCSWIDLTVTQGQGEYDSPHYFGFFLVPMALLYAYADDPAMRQRAGMMLDYLIADFAVDTLDGLYVGAFSRIYPEPTLERWRNSSTSFAWLLFGNTPFRPDAINVILPWNGYRPHGITLVLAVSGYVPTPILHHIATDRSAPYVHRELKRTRHRIRYSGVRNVPVYKYVYMREEYAVGSTQGGLLQPIQQHTWEVFWRTEDPHQGFNVLFAINASSSPEELSMYFPDEPKFVTQAVLKGKKETYDSPGKWTGGSPYEQVFQWEDALVALYDVPEGARHPGVSAFFSRDLSDLQEDASGWIFARGGDALIAYRPLAAYEWRAEPGGDRRLFSAQGKNGALVQVAPLSEYGSMEAFKSAVRALEVEVSVEPVPGVRYRTLRGTLVEAAYGGTPSVDGAAVNYSSWPLYEGPFMVSERGSRKLELRYGPMRRVLDFNTLTITDSVTAQGDRIEKDQRGAESPQEQQQEEFYA